MGHKGHYGEYTGNAKWSKVTNSNMGATKRDDKAHMKYLKEDIDYDNKHGHSDSSMTSDEKHISKLAGDLRYDEKKHGSAAKMVSPLDAKTKYTLDGKPLTKNQTGYDPSKLISDQSLAADKKLKNERAADKKKEAQAKARKTKPKPKPQNIGRSQKSKDLIAARNKRIAEEKAKKA
tara:strand:- start:179 stop:709 length:531 start_codon:yes stop_codon:yes gene_type:complete